MTVAAHPRQSIRFRGRNFMALVLAPEPPVADWLAEFDALGRRSPGFFGERPIILDVSGLPIGKAELGALVAELQARDIRLLAVEGAAPGAHALELPPVVKGGREVGIREMLDEPAAPAREPEPASLLIDSPVRSGQSVMFPKGDVTIVGSVASGAEIVAGGSIHVYGALRGRAIGGLMGNPRARIFCRKFEAELVAIDGLYKTAEAIDPQFRGRPVQAWLEGDAVRMAVLD